MSEIIITAMLLIVAVIHIIPIMGVTGAARLETLYGIPVAGRELEILMRHRAVLFGILGVFFVYAAFTPALQPLAFIGGFATLAPFFYLAFSIGGYNRAIKKIVMGDIVATISLAIAVALFYGGPAEGEIKTMPTHKHINYLELPARDIEATKAFFSEAFDWSFVDYGPDYVAFSNAGVEGGFFAAEQASTTETGGALIVLYSDALEETLAQVEAAGGQIIKPIFDFPGGRRFHFLEPSGNELAVWSEPG